MAESPSEFEEKSSSIDKINCQVRQLSLEDRICTGTRRKTSRSSCGIARALVSPNSLEDNKPKLLRIETTKSSPGSSAASPKYPNALSKIPVRQRLSTSDSAFETNPGRKNFIYSNGRILRAPVFSSSSSDSQSSETKFRKVKDRFRRSSDSCPEKGFLLPYGLRVQHAAHKCAWSESDNCSAGSRGSCGLGAGVSGSSMDHQRRGPSRGAEACSVHSSFTQQGRISANSNPRSGASSAAARRQRHQQQQSKFDFYMPLCEVQQGLKRGEILEGILRVNPRNYEDSYISAPDGQMDIYIQGLRDRNRAFNGDAVAVQLRPPQEWKIMWEAIKDYEDRQGASLFEITDSDFADTRKDDFRNASGNEPGNEPENTPGNEPENKTKNILGNEPGKTPVFDAPGNVQPIQNANKVDPSNWDQAVGPRVADSLEILGLDQLTLQFQEFTKEEESKKSRNRSKKNRLARKHQQLIDSVLQTVRQEDIPESKTNTCPDDTSVDTILQILGDPADVDGNNCSNSSVLDANSVIRDLISKDKLHGLQFLDLGNTVGQSNAMPKALSSSDDEFPTSQAVAPDELSGDEFSNSVSGESLGSHQLVQDIEDAEFFAEHQDACNNNSPSEDFPVQLNQNLEKESDPASEIQNLVDQSRRLPVPNARIVDSVNSCVVGEETVASNSNEDCLDRTVIVEPDVQADIQKNENHFPNSCGNIDSVLSCVKMVVESHEVQSVTKAIDSISIEATNDLFVNVDSPLKPSNVNIVPTEVKESTKEIDLNNSVSAKLKKHRPLKKKNKKPKEELIPKEGALLPMEGIVCNNNFAHTANKRNQKWEPRAGDKFSVQELLSLPNWMKFVQKTGKVVFIIEKKHPRVAMGYIKKQQDKNPYWALFSPTDHRMPRLVIPMTDCPKGFYERPDDFKSSLFIARITQWDENSTFAKGSLSRSLGEAGEIEPETEGILLENEIDASEFSEECQEGIPSHPWTIPQEELDKRRDFRDQCVFTIDPSTARDLDDAISVRAIDNLLEVGVHIADVSYFIQEGSALDIVASQRSTSVYLVQKVVPMLPRVLCEHLCSLNPGEDKLTFSVVWKVTPDGRIMDEWFGRTVIHSCTKFSYEHAQDMIENGERDWGPEELPPFHGRFGPRDAFWCIQQLQALALNLRKKRFDEGALRLDQDKIQFNINNETGMPSGFSIYQQQDSNRLIEELMLLANMAVAHKINKSFPKKAFLRCHPPPQTKLIQDLCETCATLGIHLDPSSAGALQATLARYVGEDIFSKARSSVLTHLCSKPMKPARYFCAGWSSNPHDFHHYALNVPLYTHFTSPIRRYPDVIVHRLLAAALNIGMVPKQTPLQLEKQAMHCNDKKLTAKRVNELSCELFLGVFVRAAGPLDEEAVVVDVMDHSFDVLILRMGVIKRIYCDKLDVIQAGYEKKLGIPKLTLVWGANGNTQIITMFTLVQVVLSGFPKDPLKFNVILKPPASRI